MNSTITVAIPTRERAETLYHALRSCTSQKTPDICILVADNCSQDETPALVSGIKDTRLRYMRSERRLSMSENWVKAINAVESGYVMILGDDDAVLPGAFDKLQRVIKEFCEPDCITWPSVEYGWPACPNTYIENLAVIPLNHGATWRNSNQELSQVLKFKAPYTQLPTIYRGLVHTRVLNRLKANSDGELINSMIPDVYLSIALSSQIKKYLHFKRPLTLNGASPHSNGTSFIGDCIDGSADQKFRSEPNKSFAHPLEYCPSLPILVAESFLQASTIISSFKKFQIDLNDVFKQAINLSYRDTPQAHARTIAALQLMAPKCKINPKTAAVLKAAKNRPFAKTHRIYGYDLLKSRYLSDCKKAGITDCFAAAAASEAIIELHEMGELSTLKALRAIPLIILREMKKRHWFC